MITVHGKITGGSVDKKGFVYSHTEAEPTLDNGESVFISAYSFNAEISLAAGKVYYMRAFAESDNNTIYGMLSKYLRLIKIH